MNPESSDQNTSVTEQAAKLKPWKEPEIQELEISRTANNPGVLSDGGVADCNHV